MSVEFQQCRECRRFLILTTLTRCEECRRWNNPTKFDWSPMSTQEEDDRRRTPEQWREMDEYAITIYAADMPIHARLDAIKRKYRKCILPPWWATVVEVHTWMRSDAEIPETVRHLLIVAIHFNKAAHWNIGRIIARACAWREYFTEPGDDNREIINLIIAVENLFLHFRIDCDDRPELPEPILPHLELK